MAALLYAFLAICLSGSALAQVPRMGACPHVKGQPNFDTYKYAGDWYEVSRSFVMFELQGRCNIINWTPTSNETAILTNTFTSGFTGKLQSISMKHELHPKNPAKTQTQLPLTPFGAISDCWTLETDYDSYSVNYCCTNYGIINLQAIWIMARSPFSRASAIARAYEVLEEHNIDIKLMWKTEQKKCSSRASKALK